MEGCFSDEGWADFPLFWGGDAANDDPGFTEIKQNNIVYQLNTE